MLLPFAPPVSEWTELHYNIYTAVETVLGNRKEYTPEEREEMAVANRAEELLEAGDPNWLDAVKDYLGSDNLDDFVVDEELFEEIDEEQRLRGY